MSIQATIRTQFKRRIINKFHLSRVVHFPALMNEKLMRLNDYDPMRVYFRYQHQSIDNHPWFI